MGKEEVRIMISKFNELSYADKIFVLYGISNAKCSYAPKKYLIDLMDGKKPKDNNIALQAFIDVFDDIDKVIENVQKKIRFENSLEKE